MLTYHQFIERKKSEDYHGVYTEKHHILPLSLGGEDVDENIIVLSAKDHIKAHFILWIENKDKGSYWEVKTFFPLKFMCHENSIQYSKLSSDDIEELELIFEEYQKRKAYLAKLLSKVNKGNTATKGRVHIHKNKKNKTVKKEELSRYLSMGWILGVYRSQKTIEKMAKFASNLHSGKIVTKATKIKLSESRKGRVWIHKEGITKSVKREQVSFFLNKGWMKGRTGLPPRKTYPNVKLKKSEVIEIREKYSKGEYTQECLAKEYSVTQSTIGRIIRKVSWKNL